MVNDLQRSSTISIIYVHLLQSVWMQCTFKKKGRLVYRKIIQSNITGVLACLLPNGFWFSLNPDWFEDQWKLLSSTSSAEQSALTHETNEKAANGYHCNVSFCLTRNACCQMQDELKFNKHPESIA